jgi:hypothetical protein
MERGMLGNWHVPCGAGEKPEITSNAYLLLTVNEIRLNQLILIIHCNRGEYSNTHFKGLVLCIF